MFGIIKNNIKLIMRNKLIIFVMIIGPMVIIAALNNAFSQLLHNGYDKEVFTLGYIAEEESREYTFFCEMIENSGLTVKKFENIEPETIIKKELADVLVYFGEDGTKIYCSDLKSVNTRNVQYILKQLEVKAYITRNDTIAANYKIENKTAKPEKTPDAIDYYGKIEIVYFLWAAVLLLTGVIQSEKKNRIQGRYLVAPQSRLSLYMSKFIPCEIMTVITIGISILLSTLVFHIHWGKAGATIGILLLGSFAAVSFGLCIVYIFKNLAVAVTMIFSITWVLGFIGGCFENYMYSSTPETVKRISPLYYMNRSLVELETKGNSAYVLPCIIFLCAITLVCSVAGMALVKRKEA